MAIVAAGLAINLASLAAGLAHRLRLHVPRSRASGRVSLILPLTGPAPALETLVARLAAQSLPPRRLIVSVESARDPAWRRVEAVRDGAPFPIELVEAGAASDRAQKCANQIAALSRLDETDDAVVFLDGDILPGATWLASLAAPILDDHSDVVTGHRWQTPARATLGAHLTATIDRGLTLLPRVGPRSAQLVWGGSLALSPAALATLDLPTLLRGTVSDDAAIADGAARHRLRMLTRGSLLVHSPVEHACAAAFSFARRQYQIGRIYRPWLWRLAAGVISLRLLAWGVALYGAVSGVLGIVPLLSMATLALAKQIVVDGLSRRVGITPPLATRALQMGLATAQPIPDMFHLAAILAAMPDRVVTWGHVTYEIASAHEVRVRARREWGHEERGP